MIPITTRLDRLERVAGPASDIAYPRLVLTVVVALAASTAMLGAILLLTGQRLAAEFLLSLLLALGMGGLAVLSCWRRYPWRVGDAAILTGLIVLALLLCGLVACLGLRLGWPVADPMLAGADAFFGVDVTGVSQAVAAMPALSTLLYYMYNASGPLCMMALVWLLLSGNRREAWQATTTILVAMQATAIISTFLPARGAASYLGLNVLQGNGLPHGAGTYALGAFERFYNGTARLVEVEHLNGIVCFPSFHTVMALVLVQALATSPLRNAAVFVGALMIVSTMPMGGHYAVDLAGGFLVWLACAKLVERVADRPAV